MSDDKIIVSGIERQAPPGYASGVTYKEIKEFPHYLIGDDGKLWSYRWNRWHQDKPKQVNGSPNEKGYIRVKLCNALGEKTEFLHKVVLEAFVGPRPEGMECRHFPDPTKTNNNLANISWGTPKQQAADRKVHGTHQFGSQHGKAKLNEAQAIEIHARLRAGEHRGDLAKEFGVSREIVAGIDLGKSWLHVTDGTRHESRDHRRGAAQHLAKLNDEKVREIRTRHAAGESGTSLAEAYQVTKASISYICSGKTWRHVQ